MGKGVKYIVMEGVLILGGELNYLLKDPICNEHSEVLGIRTSINDFLGETIKLITHINQ